MNQDSSEVADCDHSSIPHRGKNLSLSYHIQTNSWTHLAFYPNVYWESFPRGTMPVAWIWKLTPI